MKKALACLLALMLLLGVCPDMAEAPEELEVKEDLVVGSTTAMSGAFFTDLWGRNTADMDVRTLLHGYSACLTLIVNLRKSSPVPHQRTTT